LRGPSGNRPRERSNTSGWHEEALLGIEGGDLPGRWAPAGKLSTGNIGSLREWQALKALRASLRTYTSISAIPRAHLWIAGGLRYNGRRILGIPGASWAEAGPGSPSLCSRSVSGGAPHGAAKRHPRAGAGWWYFPRLRLALLGVSPICRRSRRCALKSPRPECRSSPVLDSQIRKVHTAAMFVSSPSVRHVSWIQGQLLARHQGRKQHRASVGGGYSLVTVECGDGA
jgi:hypothetical protein